MFPFLRAAHFEPVIVFEPPEATETPDVSGLAPRLLREDFRIVFFQKVHGPSVEALARELSAAGINTVYSVCDLVHAAMVSATNITVAVTEYLRSLCAPALQSKIHVVHDGIEHPEVFKKDWRADEGSRRRPLQAVLVTSSDLHELPVIGSPPDWLEVQIVGPYPLGAQRWRRLREAHWKLATRPRFRERLAYLQFLANRRIRRVAWEPRLVYERMQQADIGIIPIDTLPAPEPGESVPRWKVKSENRLTMKMCFGLPVIATPIPAYEPVIEQGRNGFFARTRAEWFESLDALRDPDSRLAIGELARKSVVSKYSMEEQARRLIDILLDLLPRSDGSPLGKVQREPGLSR